MGKDSQSGDFQKIVKDIKKYFETRYDIAKLDLVEKIVIFTSFLITTISILMLILAVMLFVSLSLAFYLGSLWHDYFAGFLVIGLFYVFAGILFFIFKDKLITNPVLRHMLTAFFMDKPKVSDDETKENQED